MKSYIFDTSFLISLLDIDDINHKKALEIISDLEIWNYAKQGCTTYDMRFTRCTSFSQIAPYSHNFTYHKRCAKLYELKKIF